MSLESKRKRPQIVDSRNVQKRAKTPKKEPREEVAMEFGTCEWDGDEETALTTHTGVMDSGCTSHVLKEDSLPENTRIDTSRATEVHTALEGSGLQTLGRIDAGILKNSLVAPIGFMRSSLVSIPTFDRNGCTTIFANGKGIITDRNGEVIAEANLSRTTNLYEFDIRTLTEKAENAPCETVMLASVKKDETLTRWHRRLGHRAERSIRNAFKKGLITGGKIDLEREEEKSDICDSCARAKSTKQSKKKRHNPVNILSDIPMSNFRSIATAQPLKKEIPLIATDLKGPMRIHGHKGEVHVQSFIECDTKFLRVYFMKAKSEASKNLQDLLEVQLASEGSHLGCYHADGAKELISQEITRLLTKSQTRMTYSPPYTAEMNSTIERNHRTLHEAAFAMLIQSHLGTVFWPYAIKYSALIFNHFPTATASGYMTPIQAKYGIVPNVSRFRIWGCVCYVHIPPATRSKEGFINKAYRSYFMGIDTTTQSSIVWIIELAEEKISADVIFDEDQLIHQTAETVTLDIAPDSKNKNDFMYLVGMVYADEEDGMDYVTTRIVVQKTFIVAYRSPYHNGTAGSEEASPIHIADVEKMVEAHMSRELLLITDTRNREKGGRWARSPPPGAGLQKDNSKREKPDKRSLRTDTDSESQRETPTASGRKRVRRGDVFPVELEEEDKSAGQTPSASSLSSAQVGPVVRKLPDGTQALPATRVRKTRQFLHAGSADEASLVVRLQCESEEYILYMEDFMNKRDSVSMKREEWKNTRASIAPSDEHFEEHCMLVTADEAKHSKAWQEADMKELNSLVCENNCWYTQRIPPGRRAITSKWVRKEKTNGTFKSRVCGRGFNMIEGIDFHETFAPVAKMTTFRIFLTIVAILRMFTGSLDIKTAYLNAKINEEVWMKPPTGCEVLLKKLLKKQTKSDMRKRVQDQIEGLKKGHVLRLLKAIYGTKQAGREWYKLMNGYLLELGFVPNRADVCFFSIIIGEDYVLLLLYVDDIIIAASTEELKMKYVKLIGKKFRTSYSGKLEKYLNIAIVHDYPRRTITMSQKRYIEAFFTQFELQEDKRIKIPMQANLNLSAVEEENVTEKQLYYVSLFPYRQLLGCILYLCICTKPMISYTVSVLGKFAANPTFLACRALVWLAKYVYNTRDELLTLGGTNFNQVNYCDSDWGGDTNTYKSRGGSIGFLGNGPVVWYSKMQSITAQSTMEAEYMSMAPCMQNGIFVRNVVNQVRIPKIKFKWASTARVDNKGAIAVANNPVRHSSTKHVALKYQYTQDCIKAGLFVTEYVRSDENCSDPMTKPLPRLLHEKHKPRCMGWTIITKSDERVRTIEDDVLECPRCNCGKAHWE